MKKQPKMQKMREKYKKKKQTENSTKIFITDINLYKIQSAFWEKWTQSHQNANRYQK